MKFHLCMVPRLAQLLETRKYIFFGGVEGVGLTTYIPNSEYYVNRKNQNTQHTVQYPSKEQNSCSFKCIYLKSQQYNRMTTIPQEHH